MSSTERSRRHRLPIILYLTLAFGIEANAAKSQDTNRPVAPPLPEPSAFSATAVSRFPTLRKQGEELLERARLRAGSRNFVAALADLYAARDLFLASGDFALVAEANGWIGNCHRAVGEHDEAINADLTAIQLFTKLDNRDVSKPIVSQLAGRLFQSGGLLMQRGRFRIALKVFHQVCDSLEDDVANSAGLSDIWGQISLCHDSLNEVQDELHAARQCLAYAEKLPDSPHTQQRMAFANARLGTSLRKSRRLREALAAFDASIKGYTELLTTIPLDGSRLYLERAVVLLDLNEPSKAIEDLRRTLAIIENEKDKLPAEEYRQLVEVGSRWLMTALERAAVVEQDTGNIDSAIRMQREFVDVAHSAFGDTSREYVDSLYGLAGHLARCGKLTEAEKHARHCVETIDTVLDSESASQSERLQFASYENYRPALDRYISLALKSGSPDVSFAEYLLRWSSRVLTAQRLLREASHHPRNADLRNALLSLDQQLGVLNDTMPLNRDKIALWRDQVGKLTDRREKLEIELGERARQQPQQPKAESIDIVRNILPDNAAFVLYFWFTDDLHSDVNTPEYAQKKYKSLVAIVIRAGRQPAIISLGNREDVQTGLHNWRQTFGTSRRGGQAGNQLHTTIWKPIQKELSGVETILVYPDGPLSQLPFGAMPGEEPGSYLIEQHRFVRVPAPSLLPHLLSQTKQKNRRPPNVLLVGDVDYGQKTPRAEQKFFSRMQWAPLPGTAKELDTIRSLFDDEFAEGDNRVTVLGGRAATEAEVRKAASECNVMHLATHGFFKKHGRTMSKDDLDRAGGGLLIGPAYADGFRPAGEANLALRAGLALTDANREPEDDLTDGVLTALEVRFMPLNGVDMVVLSACETGLGSLTFGEGQLSLHNAFHVAGARTTVASLWPVHDSFTQQLMTDFYTNRWHKGMSKIDALREAQLRLLRNARATMEGTLNRASLGNLRNENPRGDGQHLSPEYWAGFVLSGDWN